MSSRKRPPVAAVGAEGYMIVEHTHDVRLAVGLLRAAMLADEQYACPEGLCDLHRWDAERRAFVETGRVCLHKWRVGRPELRYVRKQHCFPSSYGYGEGWAFAYHEYSERGRGRFPAVVFR